MPHRHRPDVLGLRLVHRAMRADLHRLTHLLELVVAGAAVCDPRRAAATAAYLDRLYRGIRRHHEAEDRHLWPVLARVAGAEIDLSELLDDHRALDPLLDEAHAAAAAFRYAPSDPAPARRCAYTLRKVRDQVDEHLDEEERTVLPVLDRYLSAAEWRTVERSLWPRTELLFDLPRLARFASPEEFAALPKGLASQLLLPLLRSAYRRRERLILG